MEPPLPSSLKNIPSTPLARPPLTHPSPFDHVVLDDLLRARRVHGAVDERLVPFRVVVLQHQLTGVPPVLAVQVVRAAVAARTADGGVAQRWRQAQAPHTVPVQIGHVPACNSENDGVAVNKEMAETHAEHFM